MNGNKKKNKSGFTLIEILVVLAIFSILSVVIIDVFLLSLKSQRQTSARQKTLSNLRYVTETIAQKIRTSEIDFSSYQDGIIVNPVEKLALIDAAGNHLVYYKDQDQKGIKFKNESTGEEALITSPEEIEVITLAFYINPKTDPFVEERCNEDADCKDPNVGCSVLAKICKGGENNGKTCSLATECPGGECFSPPYKAGFCKCESDSDCQTGFCQMQELLCVPVDFQPMVTMVLGFQSLGTKIEEQKIIYLQTSVSSRIYKR
ncbi:MAG: type II secretion system protein [Candidatus Buchananbacteria bacterium]